MLLSWDFGMADGGCDPFYARWNARELLGHPFYARWNARELLGQ